MKVGVRLGIGVFVKVGAGDLVGSAVVGSGIIVTVEVISGDPIGDDSVTGRSVEMADNVWATIVSILGVGTEALGL